MTDLTSLTLAEARDRLKSRAISSVEITKAHLEAIERAKGLNAFVAVTADEFLRYHTHRAGGKFRTGEDASGRCVCQWRAGACAG